MNATSGKKVPHPNRGDWLGTVTDKLAHINQKHAQALLTSRGDLEGRVELTSKTGGVAGWVRRRLMFKDPQRLEEQTRGALEFLLHTLDKHGHKLSPEIAQAGRQQLQDLLGQPLGKGMPVETALRIFQDMQRRQAQKYLDAAAHATDLQATSEKRFAAQRTQPVQRTPAQMPRPEALINNAKPLSDGYRACADAAARGELDTQAPAKNPQLNALEWLANTLQVLQTEIRNPSRPAAKSLQEVWAKLPAPKDTTGIFTPARFSQHVKQQLAACTDALQALQQALASGDLPEARECCQGYVVCLEELTSDLMNTAVGLLDALAQHQLPPDLSAADKAFLLMLGESLLATVYALMEAGSPLMANHEAAIALLSMDDAELNAVRQHWSRPISLPPANLDLQPPASRPSRFPVPDLPTGFLQPAPTRWHTVVVRKPLLDRAVPAVSQRTSARQVVQRASDDSGLPVEQVLKPLIPPPPEKAPRQWQAGRVHQRRLAKGPVESGPVSPAPDQTPNGPKRPPATVAPIETTASSDGVEGFDEQVENFLNELEKQQTPWSTSTPPVINSPRRGTPFDPEEEQERLQEALNQEMADLLVQMKQGLRPKPLGHHLRDPISGLSIAPPVPTATGANASALSSNGPPPSQRRESRLKRVTRTVSETLQRPTTRPRAASETARPSKK